MAHWSKAIPKSEKGEVGRVYFVNTEIILKGGNSITKFKPFTLNPDQGSTIEGMLKLSVDLPRPAKADLLAHRRAEMHLTGGTCIKMWIAEEAAPDSEAIAAEERAKRPRLFGANGERL